MYKLFIALICGLLLATPLTAGYSQRLPPPEGSGYSPAQVLPDPPKSTAAPQIKLRYASFDPLVKIPTPSSTPAEGAGGLYLVQLKGPVRAEWREELVRAGARLYDYIPDFTFLAALDPAASKTVGHLAFVRWTGPYLPAYKLDPALTRPGKTGPPRLNLSVHALSDVDSGQLSRAIERSGGRVRAGTTGRVGTAAKSGKASGPLRGLRKLEVEAEPSALPGLAGLDSVVWLEERAVVAPDNSTAAWVIQSRQEGQYPIWAMGLTGAGPAPSAGATPGTEQIVAVSDTGFYLNHQDLGGPVYPNATVLDITNRGAAYSTGEATGADGSGHGSHVAGTVAGSGAASGGETPYNNGSRKGIAYGARLYLQQLGRNLEFLNDNTINDPITRLVEEAYARGARIQNNSWSADSYGAYDALSQEADQVLWEHPDFLGIWTAGNRGPNSSTLGSPGTAKNALTVGATNNNLNFNTVPGFTARGPTSDGRVKPDIMAPGACLYSILTNSTTGYTSKCGTSMAAPTTAGAAALVREWFQYRLNYATPQAALLKATLLNSAEYMTGVGGNLPDNTQGWGQVYLQSVLAPPAPVQFAYADNLGGLATGEEANFVYEVKDTSVPLKINLVWTDPPAALAASFQLVNDLDLQVIAPDGTTYLGNQLNGQFSVTGGMGDSVNNAEGFQLANPAAGSWKVRVRAYNVPGGNARQPFALAVRGGLNCGIPASFVTDSTDSTVTNCNTSLRQALGQAASGSTVYLTRLPDNATFYPQTPLPAIAPGVELLSRCISGLGSSPGKPAVRLSGRYINRNEHPQLAGLSLPGGNLVRGMAVGDFPGSGVELGGTGHTLRCNWVGTLDGLNPAPNGYGVEVKAGTVEVTLGQSGQPENGNLISGNLGAGVYLRVGGGEIKLYYNRIGFRFDGQPGLPNGGGIRVEGPGRVVSMADNRVSGK